MQAILLATPGLAWLLVFMIVPCLIVFVYSFFERGVYGGIDPVFSLGNFARVAEPVYAAIFFDSAGIALLATLVALIIAYPAAYAITLAPARKQSRYLLLIMLPFWVSFIIRTMSWINIMGDTGLINQFLLKIGLIDSPISMLYNEFTVLMGLIMYLLPMVGFSDLTKRPGKFCSL